MQDLNTIPSVGTFGEVARNANTNFSLLKIAVDLLEHSIEHSRGYFTSASALTTAFPSPVVGDWAIVEVSGTPVIYKCSTRGTWSNSGTQWAGGSVDLSEYLKKGTGDDDVKPTSVNYATGAAIYRQLSVENDYVIPMSNLRSCYINASGNWYNATYRHVIIPVTAGDAFYVQAPADKTSIVAWLTSSASPSHNTAAPLVDGTGLTIIAANTAQNVSAPSGASYMYILMGDTNASALAGQRKPVVFAKYSTLKEVYERELKALPAQIDNMPSIADSADADLNICDEQGNVLVSCGGGHIKTKNFDSAKMVSAPTTSDSSDADLNFSDEQGNVLVSCGGGHIKTKNFDSAKAVMKEINATRRRNFFNVKVNTLNFLDNNFVAVDVNVHENPTYYNDNAVLYLPASYRATGTPTKLIIYCKEGASTVEQTGDAILTRTKVFRYMLALGYAVMAADGVPNGWKETLHLSERAVGNYVAVQSTIRAYEYVREHYNIDTERVFIWGYSQGGHYAQNVIENSTIPIAAAAVLSPACSMRYHQWDLASTETINGVRFTKTARLNIARIFGYPAITTNEQLLALQYDPSKTTGYDPWLCHVENAFDGFVQGTQYGSHLWGLPNGISLDDITMKKHLRCPLKMWAAENDASLGVDVMKVFVKAIKNAGQIADLQLFTTGGHTIFDTQSAMGTFTENGESQDLIPLAYDVAQWYYRFGGYEPII